MKFWIWIIKEIKEWYQFGGNLNLGRDNVYYFELLRNDFDHKVSIH
jgi:hypothetical protein